ncbi:MAG: hypothetical protein HZC36_02335 [Armatimonadetes bacterium]|nr:hypothetical protein [Armatimonadota bacterium]
MRMGTLASIVVAAGCLALGTYSAAQVDGIDLVAGNQNVEITTVPAESAMQTYRVTQSSKMAKPSPASTKALQKKITKRFANANLSEVLAWLSLQDLSFVADMGAFPDRKVTFNFKNQTLKNVMDTIAETFGGAWSQKGDIYTLTPKAPSFVFSRSGKAGSQPWSSIAPQTFTMTPKGEFKLQPMPNRVWATPKTEFKIEGLPKRNFEFSLGNMHNQGKELTPAQKKEVEAAMARAKEEIKRAIEELKGHKGHIQGLDDKQLHELIKHLQEIIGKSVGGAFQWQGFDENSMDLKLFEKGEMKELHDKELAEHMKALQGLKLDEKHFGDAMKEHMKALEGLKGDHIKVFSGDEMKEHMKALQGLKLDEKHLGDAMKEHMKGLKELEGSHFKMLDSEKLKALIEKSHGNMKGLDGEKLKALMEKSHAEMKMLDADKMKELMSKAHADQKRVLELAEAGKLKAKVTGENLGKLAESLTDAQRELMKKQGYLTPKDLTEEQRKLIPDMGKGDWTLTYSKDGKSVTIKGG